MMAGGPATPKRAGARRRALHQFMPVADLNWHGRPLPEGVAVTSEVRSPIRLLVADDHDILRQGLVAVLERDPRFSVVATASNGEEAVAAFRRTQPDLAIMDFGCR